MAKSPWALALALMRQVPLTSFLPFPLRLRGTTSCCFQCLFYLSLKPTSFVLIIQLLLLHHPSLPHSLVLELGLEESYPPWPAAGCLVCVPVVVGLTGACKAGGRRQTLLLALPDRIPFTAVLSLQQEGVLPGAFLPSQIHPWGWAGLGWGLTHCSHLFCRGPHPRSVPTPSFWAVTPHSTLPLFLAEW